MPFQINDDYASNRNVATWNTFEAVNVAAVRYEGVGFVLTDTDKSAFDLDKCRNAVTGEVDPWAKELVDRANSYAEVTPSGTGLRIIGRGSGPEVHRQFAVGANGAKCEVYRKAARYITITGNVYRDAPLANVDAVVDAVVAELDRQRERSSSSAEHSSGTADLPLMLESLLSVVGSGAYGVLAALDRRHQAASVPVVFPVAGRSLGGGGRGNEGVVWFGRFQGRGSAFRREARRSLFRALVEEEHRQVIDLVKADHKKAADLVEFSHEQSKRLIAEVTKSFFDRIEAKLDQFATLGTRRPD